MAAGSDGNVWFVEGLNTVNQIARIDISTGAITEFPLPPCAIAPEYVARGSDDRFWMGAVCPGVRNLWAVVSTTGVGQLVEPPNSLGSFHEVLGPDGNIWYTVYVPGEIGNITPGGVESYFSLSTTQRPAHGPSGIAVGPDGDLWVAEVSEPYIDRVSTSGAIVDEYTLPTLTDGITAGPDGNMWFTGFASDEIGFITPTGQATIYPLTDQCAPGTGGLVGPLNIVKGPDGNLWFTEQESYGIGRITPSGVVSSFCTPPTPYGPFDLSAGPDGNIWFTESGLNDVGKVILAFTKQQGTRLRPIHLTLGQNCSRMASLFTRRVKFGLVDAPQFGRQSMPNLTAWRNVCHR
jgi:streptogramin lyase